MEGYNVIIKNGWENAGRRGVALSDPIFNGLQRWVVVQWDDEEDPDLVKEASIFLYVSKEQEVIE